MHEGRPPTIGKHDPPGGDSGKIADRYRRDTNCRIVMARQRWDAGQAMVPKRSELHSDAEDVIDTRRSQIAMTNEDDVHGPAALTGARSCSDSRIGDQPEKDTIPKPAKAMSQAPGPITPWGQQHGRDVAVQWFDLHHIHACELPHQ